MHQCPIVFIHRGYSDYMEYSLRQARLVTPPEIEIILLGDATNDRFDFVTHVDMADFSSTADAFAQNYRHYSTNPFQYELFCIKRWFVLNEYMASRKIETVFAIDTDVMLYEYPGKLIELFFTGYQLSGIGNYGVYSGGQAFWRREGVSQFCDLITSIYREPENVDSLHRRYINISDMTLFGEFIRNSGMSFMNLLGVYDGETTDAGMNIAVGTVADEYRLSIFRQKKIWWKNRVPYAFSRISGCPVKMVLLHFQGFSKYRMAEFYRGEDFPQRGRLDLKFFFANIAAWLYGQLISPVRYRVRLIWLAYRHRLVSPAQDAQKN